MNTQAVKVLFVVNGYPTLEMPEYCIFNKEQIEALLGTKKVAGEVIFINAQDKGKKEYIKSLASIRNSARNCDIVHCFHGLSFIATALVVPDKPIITSFLNALAFEYRESPKFDRFLQWITSYFIKIRHSYAIFKDKVPSNLSCCAFHLPNGVSTENFNIIDRNNAKYQLGLATEKRYVLFVSSKTIHRKQKRYDRFQKTIELLKQVDPSIEELVLVGQPRNLVPLYFNAASLHIISSDFEGSPNSVKEALACGTPIVSTNVGNVQEMIVGAPNCYVVEDFYVKSLFRYSLESLAKEPDRLAIRDRIFLNKLDLDTSTSVLIGIYERTIERYGMKGNV